MTDAHKREQDVRFSSSLAWVWWPLISFEDRTSASVNEQRTVAECIDGTTGHAHNYSGEEEKDSNHRKASMVCTGKLVRLFSEMRDPQDEQESEATIKTLKQLRAFKRNVSPEYEAAKDDLLSKHRVFRQWRRREYDDE